MEVPAALERFRVPLYRASQHAAVHERGGNVDFQRFAVTVFAFPARPFPYHGETLPRLKPGGNGLPPDMSRVGSLQRGLVGTYKFIVEGERRVCQSIAIRRSATGTQ